MTSRAQRLHATADEQIAELIHIVSLEDHMLRRPLPGREKLGDGTIGASARHTADNYQRIAGFIATSSQMTAGHDSRGHRMPGFLRGLGHPPRRHTAPPGAGHDVGYSADTTNPRALADQLTATRGALGRIADLTDSQLDAIPPIDSFRFADGRRTLEQVLASLLKHQAHQLAALTAAVA
jgi:hypothetical protein